jgi:hypothetical protein
VTTWFDRFSAATAACAAAVKTAESEAKPRTGIGVKSIEGARNQLRALLVRLLRLEEVVRR